ncbi:hypothetical protein FL583_30080 [Cryptosporangium phraense]|uniref:HTH lysR-type domain-containing protein n=1 Tax=Cryptosporangium phraense TaxID=2593070 RepID=A0A545AKZ6_9ACTN|nr:hypothetical protein FL583_30080 [Cryptosporangium phraense]
MTRLEQQVGARLLDRTPHGTRLTPAGEVFLPHARAALDAMERAAVRTRVAADLNRITVGYAANLIVTPAVRALRRLHPEADVRTLHVDWQAPQNTLLEHRVDVLVARLPFPVDGLRVTVLYDEPRLLLVPDDHRLVGRETVTLDDIKTEPMPRILDPIWDAFWRVDPRPDGSRAPDGPARPGHSGRRPERARRRPPPVLRIRADRPVVANLRVFGRANGPEHLPGRPQRVGLGRIAAELRPPARAAAGDQAVDRQPRQRREHDDQHDFHIITSTLARPLTHSMGLSSAPIRRPIPGRRHRAPAPPAAAASRPAPGATPAPRARPRPRRA